MYIWTLNYLGTAQTPWLEAFEALVPESDADAADAERTQSGDGTWAEVGPGCTSEEGTCTPRRAGGRIRDGERRERDAPVS